MAGEGGLGWAPTLPTPQCQTYRLGLGSAPPCSIPSVTPLPLEVGAMAGNLGQGLPISTP